MRTTTLFLAVAVAAAACVIQSSKAAPGDRYLLLPDALPAPYATQGSMAPHFVERPAHAIPSAPHGFSVSVFATNLSHARWLAVAPNGDVFLSEQRAGKITLLRDANGDGRAEMTAVFASGFEKPHGIAFHDGAFYAADVRAVWRIAYRDGDRVASAAPVRVTAAPDLQPDGWHTAREIAFDSKGRLYVDIGSSGDVDEDPPPRGTVQEVAPDGTMTIFASGLRNASGLAVHPDTDELWAAVNERDELGNGLPPDFVAHLAKGDFFGWPYAYTGPHPDPIFGARRPDLVAKSKVPALLIQAHSAPLGITFYRGTQFPAEYRGDAFVALHGSGPWDNPSGYKVIRVRFANGKPIPNYGYEDFVTGFWAMGTNPPTVWGTPAGLAVAKDGSLLIADDRSGTVWRVAYTGR